MWIAVFVVVFFGWRMWAGRVRVVAAERAPEASRLALVAPDGRRSELADYRGRVVVVNVWASWCGPCRSEIPGFSRVYLDLRDRGLEVLGVNVDDAGLDWAGAGQSLGIEYTQVRPEEGFGGTFPFPEIIPHSWFIDRQGRVRASHSGYLTESALRAAVIELLEEEAESSADVAHMPVPESPAAAGAPLATSVSSPG